jgi:hypothetical protein
MSDDSEVLENLFAKARRSFEAAEGLLVDGHADFAASRAYYGYFYYRSPPTGGELLRDAWPRATSNPAPLTVT